MIFFSICLFVPTLYNIKSLNFDGWNNIWLRHLRQNICKHSNIKMRSEFYRTDDVVMIWCLQVIESLTAQRCLWRVKGLVSVVIALYLAQHLCQETQGTGYSNEYEKQ